MCNRMKGVMLSEDFRQGFISLVRGRCKMWDCPDCGPIEALRWRAYLLDRMNKAYGHAKWCFLTITARPSSHVSVIASIKNLQRGWKLLYDKLKRHYGRAVEYIRVFEPHKSGRFHMHILMDIGEEYDAHNFVAENLRREFRHPECQWLRRACVAAKMGWRVHMRRVWDDVKKTANVGLVVGYIMKYVSKQMSDFEFPKHQRRIQTSRKIGSPNPKDTGLKTASWEHKREISEKYLERAQKPILDISTGEVLTKDSFEGEGYYPPLRFYRG